MGCLAMLEDAELRVALKTTHLQERVALHDILAIKDLDYPALFCSWFLFG